MFVETRTRPISGARGRQRQERAATPQPELRRPLGSFNCGPCVGERKRRRASSPEASEVSSRKMSLTRSKISSQEGFRQRDSRSRSYSPELHNAAVEQDIVPTGGESRKHLRDRSPPYDRRRPPLSSGEAPILAQAFIGNTPSVAQISGSITMNMAIPPRPSNYDGLWPRPPPPPPAPQHRPAPCWRG